MILRDRFHYSVLSKEEAEVQTLTQGSYSFPAGGTTNSSNLIDTENVFSSNWAGAGKVDGVEVEPVVGNGGMGGQGS